MEELNVCEEVCEVEIFQAAKAMPTPAMPSPAMPNMKIILNRVNEIENRLESAMPNMKIILDRVNEIENHLESLERSKMRTDFIDKAIRRQAVMKLTETTLVELEAIWEDLCFAPDQRYRFSPVTDEEKLLELYLKELECLRRLKDNEAVCVKFVALQNNRKIVTGIEERLVDASYVSLGEVVEMENIKRKTIPRQFHDLKAAVISYEQTLLVYGRSLVEFVQEFVE